MNSQSPLSAAHYSLVRILLGIYLLIHFTHLIPYGAELFSSAGLLPAELSPLLGILPNPLTTYDSKEAVFALLLVGSLCGAGIAIGLFDRTCSIIAAIILGWLYARNPLIANPSLPVVGWMLIAHAMLPQGAYGSWSSRGQPEKWIKWSYPGQIWFAAWALLAVAYTYSGYTKALSPSWVDGTAIQLVLENPLARDHFIREILLALPPVFLQLLTWLVLVVELLFVVFCFWPIARKWAWLIMLVIQFGFLIFLNFADLTFPMLLIHLLTFDRRWLAKYQKGSSAMLFYDGTCAFCNGLVRFALSEDLDDRLSYSPLQGRTHREMGLVPIEDDSISVLTSTGGVFHKSDAAIECLSFLGGIWILLARVIGIFPKCLRDWFYDVIGSIRYRLAGKVDPDICQLLPGEYRERMLP